MIRLSLAAPPDANNRATPAGSDASAWLSLPLSSASEPSFWNDIPTWDSTRSVLPFPPARAEDRAVRSWLWIVRAALSPTSAPLLVVCRRRSWVRS